MYLEQVQFPESGPNWGKILLVSVGTIAVAYLVYTIVANPKVARIAKIAEENSGKSSNI